MTIGMFTDVYRPSVNGVTRSIEATKAALEVRGHRVVVFAPHVRGQMTEPDVIRLPSIKRLSPATTPIGVSFLPFVLRRVKSLKLDVIHTHLPFFIGTLGHTVARWINVPAVHTYHTHLTEYAHYAPPVPGLRGSVRYGLRRLAKRCCNGADHVIAPSTAIRTLLEGYGVTTPITVLPSGIVTSDFARLPDARRVVVRQQYGIPTDAILILFAGRLAKEKNVPFLLKAFAQVATNTQNVHLVLAGGGPTERHIGRVIRSLKLSERVSVTGLLPRSEMTLLFGSADIFAFASVTETQGIVIAEALAASCPVVAVDALGVKDGVQDGVNGYLVPHDVDAFAMRINELASHSALRARMGAAALESAAAFSIDATTDRLVELYANLSMKTATRI